MLSSDSPIPRLLGELGSRPAEPLAVDGLDVAGLIEAHGTPLFVYSAAAMRRRLARVRAALGPRVQVLYAVKANPSVAVVQVFRAAGAGAELASAGELEVAQAAGVEGRAMQFAGPGKNRAELAAAVAAGVWTINLESADEYDDLAALAAACGARPAVAIRVNPELEVRGSRLRMGGGSKKFGVDADVVPALAARIRAEDRVELRGLHVYAGTQCFDAAAWLAGVDALYGVARQVEAETGAALASLNFGGGFAVPHFAGDAEFDLAAAGEGLQARLAADRADRRLFVELGRYLVAEAGIYVTRVLRTKVSHGRSHAVVDGGMHHHAAAAGLGAVIRRPFPAVHAAAPWTSAGEPVTVGGPLCTPQDELLAGVPLPHLAAGDAIAFLSSGAYGLTFSPTLFLGHPLPAEVLVDDGTAHLIRARGRPSDILRDQSWPKI